MNFWWPGADGRIQGPAAAKRTSASRNRYSLSVSYALQFSESIRDVTQNLNDYFATYGPDLPRHNLTVSGDGRPAVAAAVVGAVDVPEPPARWRRPSTASTTPARTTRPPGYTPLLGILGKGYADFLSNEELESLVAEYNATIRRHARRRARRRRAWSPTSATRSSRCPTDYDLGDVFTSQDVRVTKAFRLGRQHRDCG